MYILTLYESAVAYRLSVGSRIGGYTLKACVLWSPVMCYLVRTG